MDKNKQIKEYEAKIKSINDQLSAKSARDFETEAAAAKWYKNLCADREELENHLNALKNS
ncbi:MAG: hypothetical protein V4525_12530 [Pseudomonadota bacterium]